VQSSRISELIYLDKQGDEGAAVELRNYLIEHDYLAPMDSDLDLRQVCRIAQGILEGRQFATSEGADGLDGVRHNLRVLRRANLPETRLIICSMEGERNYPDIDRLLASDEFSDMAHRVIITAEPNYLARFTSSNQVIAYQRRFMGAASAA
jgi:hypothetical protein